MAAVAQRITSTEKVYCNDGYATSKNRTNPRVRVCTMTRSKRQGLAVWSMLLFVPLFMFLYMNTYANLKVKSYNRSKLARELREETLKNQRLKVKLVVGNSPSKITAAAEKNGMVYVAEYDYAGAPSTLASASIKKDL